MTRGSSARRRVWWSTGPASATTRNRRRPSAFQQNPAMTRTGRLPVSGADLYFEIEGSGPPVVLVHGFSLDARMWDDQVPALRDIATVIRYDVRGFGRSSMPDADVLYAQSTDLVALLD